MKQKNIQNRHCKLYIILKQQMFKNKARQQADKTNPNYVKNKNVKYQI